VPESAYPEQDHSGTETGLAGTTANLKTEFKISAMKKLVSIGCLLLIVSGLQAQYREKNNDGEERTFKENLFTGGSISLAFYNNTFLVGASPVFGYSLADFADAGVVVNYSYTSYRDFNGAFNDKLRQSVYGGGAFLKLYPVKFLFAQAQVEHNYIRQKYLAGGSDYTEIAKGQATSFLVGGGYTSGREGRGGEPFYYLAVLFDLSKDIYSPYTDGYGRTIPIIRAGLQIPLFQGGGNK
jgi:hypothetical protein